MFRSPGKMAWVFGLGVAVGFVLPRSAPTPILAGGGRQEAVGGPAGGGPKPATAATKKANTAFAKTLPFADKQAFADAQKGFMAPLPDKGVIKNSRGAPVWDLAPFSFIKLDADCPDTVNP